MFNLEFMLNKFCQFASMLLYATQCMMCIDCNSPLLNATRICNMSDAVKIAIYSAPGITNFSDKISIAFYS